MNQKQLETIDHQLCHIASMLHAIEEIAISHDERFRTDVSLCLNASIMVAQDHLDKLHLAIFDRSQEQRGVLGGVAP